MPVTSPTVDEFDEKILLGKIQIMLFEGGSMRGEGMGIARITTPGYEMGNIFWQLVLDSAAQSQNCITLASNFIYYGSGYTRVNLYTANYH